MTASATPSAAPPSSVTPYLLISKGPQRGSTIQLDFETLTARPFVLGRLSSEVDFVLQSSRNRVSRKHVAFSFRAEDDLLVVSDAGSSNGTQLNGQYIAGPTPIFPGDTVSCGDVDLIFVVPLETMGLPLVMLPGQTERVYIEDSEPGIARLEIVSTQVPTLRPDSFCRLTPKHPFVVGRYSTNDLPLLEEEEFARRVSRRHVEIRGAGEDYIIRDLGAANPAWIIPKDRPGLNNQPFQLERPYRLRDGDRIEIGSTILRYRAPRLPLATQALLDTSRVTTAQPSLRYAGRRPLLDGPATLILPADRQILIGRNEGNDLRLQDRSVSRRHARLFFEAGHFMLVDLGSANGTRINSQRLSRPALLKAGDRVGLGDFEFIFEIASAPAVEDSPAVSSLANPALLQLGQSTAAADSEAPEPTNDREPSQPVIQLNGIEHPLRKIAPFDELDSATFNLLLPYFQEVHYQPGQEMAREGQNRGVFFAILEGNVSISRRLAERQRLTLGQLGPGAVYGERTVFADKPFGNRLEALTPVRALRLEEAAFVSDLASNSTVRSFFAEQVSAASATTWLRTTLLLRGLSETTRRQLANRLRFRTYEKGQLLAEEGRSADEFFLVLSGNAEARVKDSKGQSSYLATLQEGDSFGDGIAVDGDTYPMTVQAETQVECYVLRRADFESVLAKSTDPLVSLGLGAGLGGLPLGAVLNRVGPFMTMPPQVVAQIAAAMKPKFFKKGEIIVSQNETASAFYIIRSGQVEVSFRTSGGEVRSDMRLGPGQFFGEAALLTNTARTDTVKATDDCELLALYRNKLEEIIKIGGNYELTRHFVSNLNKSFRPKQVSDVAITEHTSATGEHYYLLARAGGEQFFKLSESSLFLWQLMDGDNSLNDLSMAYFLEFKRLDLEGVSSLVGQLQAAGFLEVPSIDRNFINPENPRHHGRLFRLFNWRYEIKNVDHWFDRLYQWGGQVFFWRPMVVGLLLVIFGGFGAFLYEGLLDKDGTNNLLKIFAGGGLGAFTVPGALPWWFLLVALAFNFMIHEVAHGLACKAFGRRVLGGGFGLQYGGPVFFVNTNEMWLEKRGPRIVVNLAGPVANALFAGVCCLLILITPNHNLQTAFFQMAAVAYALVYINLNPLMELDGYYALSDWFEIPNLRRKALGYVRRRILRKPQPRSQAVSERDRRIFWAYTIATPIYLIFTVIQFSFFLGSLLGSLRVAEGLATIGLSKGAGDLLLWLLTVLIAGFLAWPLVIELLTIGRDEDEQPAAKRPKRRRRN